MDKKDCLKDILRRSFDNDLRVDDAYLAYMINCGRRGLKALQRELPDDYLAAIGVMSLVVLRASALEKFVQAIRAHAMEHHGYTPIPITPEDQVAALRKMFGDN